jgi:hypothetical protein
VADPVVHARACRTVTPVRGLHLSLRTESGTTVEFDLSAGVASRLAAEMVRQLGLYAEYLQHRLDGPEPEEEDADAGVH